MASLSKTEGKILKRTGKKGRPSWRIEFYLENDPKRKCILRGKITERQAETVKTRIELLIASHVMGVAPDVDTSRWVAERNDAFHIKLATVGLVPKRIKATVPTLSSYLDDYIESRTDVKP